VSDFDWTSSSEKLKVWSKRQQNLDVLDFLIEACTAKTRGAHFSSVLPAIG
jgi:hypothetical protein